MPDQKPHILLAEDDPHLGELLSDYLNAEEFRVTLCRDGEEALRSLEVQVFDLCLLDVMMPKLDGFETCMRIRSKSNVPIIMITARGEEEERVRGLATGADDYVVKPFSMPELGARIKALLRRSSPQLATTLLKAGDLELDRQSHRVRRAGRDLHLGPTEYRLLAFFMSHPERVYTRSQLLDNVWGSGVYVEERTVDVHIRRLRKCLEPCGLEEYIQTVRGAGYRFSTTV